jgi:predicted ribosome-associated RNA-binding protein Tma20
VFRKKFLSRLPAAAASVFDQQKQTFSLLRAVTSKGSAFKIYLCDGTPMFFECDKGDEDATLLPSVFFTWIAPSCYPIICVHSSLLETLRGGADLMAPGIREIATSQEFEANSPVTVALLPASGESRKVDGPALVGKSLLSLHEILSSGGRGRAVQIYHSIHDALWYDRTNRTRLSKHLTGWVWFRELGDRTIPMPKITLPIVGDSEREHQPEGGEATVDALSRLELNESAVNGGGKSPEKTSSVEVDMESVVGVYLDDPRLIGLAMADDSVARYLLLGHSLENQRQAGSSLPHRYGSILRQLCAKVPPIQ